jgi:hypothetical protein
MSNLSLQVREFFSLKSETIENKIIEVIIKLWMASLTILFLVTWSTIVIYTIMNPNMWDGVQFGLIDTMGY